MKAPHVPVLLEEVRRSFSTIDSGYLVDCTLGYGGHSHALLQDHPRLHLLGIDRDEEALEFSRKRLGAFSDRATLIHGDFASTVSGLTHRPIAGILADFGVSSLQLDKHERGFGFRSDVLDMRMDQSAALTAETVVNTYTHEQLRYCFAEYGEIRAASQLADAVVSARLQAPIRSAAALSTLAQSVLPSGGKLHPATLMFQAIRIEVNDELGQIEGLLDALELLRPAGAIVSLITFHSLEDRLVKRRFKKWTSSCICDPNVLRCTCGNNHRLGTLSARKPLVASAEEIRTNPRSRSAKLRTFVFEEAP